MTAVDTNWILHNEITQCESILEQAKKQLQLHEAELSGSKEKERLLNRINGRIVEKNQEITKLISVNSTKVKDLELEVSRYKTYISDYETILAEFIEYREEIK